MSNGRKFVLLMFLIFTILSLIGLNVVLENEPGRDSVMETFVVLAAFWAVGALVYRRHVNRNPWLRPATKARMRYVVTLYGPLGWFAYYVSHVHPHEPDDVPPGVLPPDAPYTDADRLL